jgi:hypothetical protein
MLRFSMRELMLVVVIVPLALGWVARERQLRSELNEAKLWRCRAGALEFALNQRGRFVRWNFKGSEVWVRDGDGSQSWAHISTTEYQPSSDSTTDWPWK